ncbi:MAG: hypothetical protein AAFR60_11920, partial [Pseudomonadota bacterium]
PEPARHFATPVADMISDALCAAWCRLATTEIMSATGVAKCLAGSGGWARLLSMTSLTEK